MLMFCAPAAGRFPGGLVKGDPSHQQKKERPPQCIFTELYSKDVRPVTRFDEYDLILVREVEWLAIICSD